MKVITFANSKGGVGKTTLTVNLINVLSQLDKKILVIDTDPQANLSRIFSEYKDNQELELWFKESSKEKLLKSIKKTNNVNVDIVPAYSDLINQTNNYITGASMGELLLKNNLNSLKKELNKYDYLLFDTFPSMNKILLAVLLASEEIIIPIEPHRFSYEGFATIKKPYENAINNLNKIGIKTPNNIKWFILNKVQKNKLHIAVIENLLESENKEMFLETQIPLSAVRQKETMLNKFSNITEKNPIYKLVVELKEKGVL